MIAVELAILPMKVAFVPSVLVAKSELNTLPVVEANDHVVEAFVTKFPN